MKAKAFYPKLTGSRKKIREISRIQIVKGFVLNSEYLTEEGNEYLKCELFILFQLRTGGKEV